MSKKIRVQKCENLDWAYWTSLQSISYQDAAHLIFGVDPISSNLASGNNCDQSDERGIEVRRVIKQIEAEIRCNKENEFNSPWEWVCWAESMGINVPQQFHEQAYEAKVESIQVIEPQPLEIVSKEILEWYLKQDSWTYYEAIFLMKGYKPPGDIEGFDEVTSHFPVEYLLLQRGLAIGAIGKVIKQYGHKNFIDTPERWMSWGKDKGFDLDVINNFLLNNDYTQTGSKENPEKRHFPIPGKIPRNGINRLVVIIAWEIEQELRRRADAKEIMQKLREWAEDGKKFGDVLSPAPKDYRGSDVYWLTIDGDKKKFSLSACKITLGRWHKSRH